MKSGKRYLYGNYALYVLAIIGTVGVTIWVATSPTLEGALAWVPVVALLALLAICSSGVMIHVVLRYAGVTRGVADLRSVVEKYWVGAYSDSGAFLEDLAGQRRLELLKASANFKRTLFGLVLDRSHNSDEVLRQAQSVLTRESIPFVAEQDGQGTCVRLRMWTDRDVALATRVATLIVTEVFGIRGDTQFRVERFGLCSRREAVGWDVATLEANGLGQFAPRQKKAKAK